MRDDGRPQTYLHPVMDFNTFRVFVLEVYVVSYEHFAIELDAPKTVEKGTERGCARQKTRQNMQ